MSRGSTPMCTMHTAYQECPGCRIEALVRELAEKNALIERNTRSRGRTYFMCDSCGRPRTGRMCEHCELTAALVEIERLTMAAKGRRK